MKRDEVIEQLESLKAHCKSMAEYGESDSEWKVDVKALEIAIDAIKATAQEVPVQEQYVITVKQIFCTTAVVCTVYLVLMLIISFLHNLQY